MSEVKKFKVIFTYKDEFNQRIKTSATIEATSEDEAVEKLDELYPDSEATEDVYDCYEVVEHPTLNKMIVFDMPDGLTYGLKVEHIARHHANYFAKYHDGDVAKCLREETIPLFSDDYEIEDWAKNNMNWKDVYPHVVVLSKKTTQPDMQEGWLEAEFEVKGD